MTKSRVQTNNRKVVPGTIPFEDLRGEDIDRELQVILCEYQMIRGEMLERIEGQKQLNNIIVALLGASITVFGVIQPGTITNVLLLVLPVFFFALLQLFLREDVNIFVLTIFIGVHIRQKLDKLLRTNQSLYWEEFIATFRSKNSPMTWILWRSLALSRYLIPIIGAGISLGLFAVLNRDFLYPTNPTQTAKLIWFLIDIVLYAIVILELIVLNHWVSKGLDNSSTIPAKDRTPF